MPENINNNICFSMKTLYILHITSDIRFHCNILFLLFIMLLALPLLLRSAIPVCIRLQEPYTIVSK